VDVILLLSLAAVNSMRPGMDSTSCILVEDSKAVAQDEEPLDLTSSQAPTEGKCISGYCTLDQVCNCFGTSLFCFRFYQNIK
jgi:hypothetical protein